MFFRYTPFETGYDFSKSFTALMFLGCGIVIVHAPDAISKAEAAGYKLHTIRGRKVGFSLFTKQV